MFIEGGHESVTIPSPIKIVAIHLMVLRKCCVILFGLRFDMVAFYGIVLGLFGTVWHRLALQHLTFFVAFDKRVSSRFVAGSEQW